MSIVERSTAAAARRGREAKSLEAAMGFSGWRVVLMDAVARLLDGSPAVADGVAKRGD